MRRKEMKNRDAVMAGFWVLFGLTIAVWSCTFPFGDRKAPGPGLLPLAAGLAMIVLGCILFLQALKGKAPSEKRRPFLPERGGFMRVALSL